MHDAKWSKMPTIKSGWSIKTSIKRSPVHCYFCTPHRMCPYYLYRYSNVLKLAPILEGLLLEVMCKEELKRTITYDFMYISVVLEVFLAHPVCTFYANRLTYLYFMIISTTHMTSIDILQMLQQFWSISRSSILDSISSVLERFFICSYVYILRCAIVRNVYGNLFGLYLIWYSTLQN